MAIRVEAKKDSDQKSIVLEERFDFEAVGPFRTCYEGMDSLKNTTLNIDFRDTRYIDSSALGMLINARNFFEERSVKVNLINTSEQVRKIFSISRFDKKFNIS